MTIERKTFDLDLKEAGEDGTFSMYAATWDGPDRGGDVIEPGAFANLDEFISDGWIALNHRAGDLPVGYPTAAVQDGKGLLISGRFHETAEAQACRQVVRERLAAGKGVKASIGYQVDASRMGMAGGEPVRILERIRIYEASFVNLPMNERADVIAAKSREVEPMPEIEEKIGLLEALKELLGLSRKAVDGGKMSKAGLTRMKAFAEAIGEHGDRMKDHAKQGHEYAKHCKTMCSDMKSFLKSYDAEEEGETEDDPAEEEAEGEGEGEGDKGRKSAPPPPVNPVLPSREQMARRLAALPPPYRR